MISALAGIPKVVLTIVSGRTIESLLDLFNGMDKEIINWSGVHGGQVKYMGSGVLIPAGVKKIIPVIEELKQKISGVIDNIPCYFLEDKGLSFAIHYRKCKGEELAYLEKINSELLENIEGKPVELMQMKKVIEVKPEGINKGRAIQDVRRKYGENVSSINICLGDDVTDEYLFKSNTSGINIKVGVNGHQGPGAEYYLKNVGEVHQFLDTLYNILK